MKYFFLKGHEIFGKRSVLTQSGKHRSDFSRSQPNGSAYDSRGLFVSSGHSSLSYATHLSKNLSGKAEIAVGVENNC